MIAASATLAVLVTMWLIVVVGASVLEQSSGKIAAALKGQPPYQPMGVAVRIPARARMRQPMRAQAEWRDAA